MAEVTKDPENLFSQIKQYLYPYFPGFVFYAYGSRTTDAVCNKCDFDIVLSIGEEGETLVKFLQEVGVYGTREYRKKLQIALNGKSVFGIDYLKRLTELYIREKKIAVTSYFNFRTDENGNPIRVDLSVRYGDISNKSYLAPII